VRLLIVGNRGGTNVGGCFERAAIAARIEVAVLESRQAMQAPGWLRRANWYLLGRRPARLRSFGRMLVETATRFKPDMILATGIAPLDRGTLKALNSQGIPVANYLTDDPWSPAHRAPWFLRALSCYTVVFSTRHSNMADLGHAGCHAVAYLPFGYDPGLHFREDIEQPEDRENDVLFIGAADRNRAAYCLGLLESGIRPALYGDYWGQFEQLRQCWHGYAQPAEVRRLSRQSRLQLCLVRHANRDGHTMRSFEAAALGGCLLMEDTFEHRTIFGPEREAVLYFKSVTELQDSACWLLAHDGERRRLARAAHARITEGANTYADRLRTILQSSSQFAQNGAAPEWICTR